MSCWSSLGKKTQKIIGQPKLSRMIVKPKDCFGERQRFLKGLIMIVCKKYYCEDCCLFSQRPSNASKTWWSIPTKSPLIPILWVGGKRKCANFTTHWFASAQKTTRNFHPSRVSALYHSASWRMQRKALYRQDIQLLLLNFNHIFLLVTVVFLFLRLQTSRQTIALQI